MTQLENNWLIHSSIHPSIHPRLIIYPTYWGRFRRSACEVCLLECLGPICTPGTSWSWVVLQERLQSEHIVPPEREKDIKTRAASLPHVNPCNSEPQLVTKLLLWLRTRRTFQFTWCHNDTKHDSWCQIWCSQTVKGVTLNLYFQPPPPGKRRVIQSTCTCKWHFWM